MKSRLLEGLPPGDLKSILAAATQRRFLAHSTVVNQDHPANQLFLLTKGRARFYYLTPEGKKIILFWLAPGEAFGGAALLSKPSLYLVSTETVRDSCVLVWDSATIRALAARYPRLQENALSIAMDYFAWYLTSHVALTCHSAQQRLAQVLVCLSRVIGEKVPNGVELDVTNEELANAANITPFTTSRLLSEWRRKSAVVKRRGKLLLRSPERLFLRAT
jgi:CRP-like cAMP-binding protein